MATMSGLDFSKICRVCCSSKDTMISIFRVHISKKIMSLASVQIWESDGLPSQICNECIVKLDVSFQFKKLCEKSDQTLRRHKSEEEKMGRFRKSKIKSKRQKTYEINATNSLLEQLQYADLSTSTVDRNNDVSASDIQLSDNVLTDISHTIPSSFKTPTELIEFTYEDVEDLEDMKPTPSDNNNDKGYRCEICLKVFATSYKLSRHGYFHAGRKPFQCQICNKSFSHNSNLKAHMKLHSEERPYICEICKKGCKRSKDLELHMRTHTGHKPHVCHTCGRAFSSSSNLIAHERIHTGEKPYVCAVCHKAFCQSNQLIKHRKIHKTQTDSNNISQETIKLTSVQNHDCNICFKSFTSPRLLSVHMEKHQLGIIDT